MHRFIYPRAFMLALGFFLASCSKSAPTPQHEQAAKKKEITKLLEEWEKKQETLLKELKELYIAKGPKDSFEKAYLDEHDKSSLLNSTISFQNPRLGIRKVLHGEALNKSSKSLQWAIERLQKTEERQRKGEQSGDPEMTKKERAFYEKLLTYYKQVIDYNNKIMELLKGKNK